MASVKFTYHLSQFFPDLAPTAVDGGSVAEIVAALDHIYAGIATYITDEHGALRRHVNIFVDGSLITDRLTLSDLVSESSQVYVMQALSGG